MRKLMLIIALNMLFALGALAQKAVIKAERAKYHVGETVTVIDSIASIVIQDDSTTIISMGSVSHDKPLTLILKFPFVKRTDTNILEELKYTLLEVKGKLNLTHEQPAITVYNKNDLYFYSPVMKRQWTYPDQETIGKLR